MVELDVKLVVNLLQMGKQIIGLILMIKLIVKKMDVKINYKKLNY